MAFISINPLLSKPPPANLQRSYPVSMCSISYRSTFRNEIQRARDFLTQRAVQQVGLFLLSFLILI